MSPFRLKFTGFRQVFIDQTKILSRYHRQAGKALGKIGAVLRQEARKSIRRRIVTSAMRVRLGESLMRGDKRAIRRARATIERRQSAVSAPFQPPFAHVPDHPVASIRAIYFGLLPDRREVLVGPVQANQVTIVGGSRSSVPELLEFGGRATIHEEQIKYVRGQPGPWVRRDRRRGTKAWKRYRTRSAVYAPRPFMGPTLSRNQQLIRNLLAASFATS